MNAAISAAKEAFGAGEIPVGAVIVKDNTILSIAHNRTEEMNDFTYHAELIALREACSVLSSKYLNGCEMYVTLEPCPMCAGAIMHTRLTRLYFGAYDTLKGAFGSALDLSACKNANKIEIYGGINERECADLMSNFFDLKR